MDDNRNSSIIFGLVIIAFGFAILISALHMLKLNFDVGPWWPALLIFAGALSAGKGRSAIPFGMIGVGALLLARNLGLYANNSALGGALFLLIGIGVLAVAITPKSASKKPKNSNDEPLG